MRRIDVEARGVRHPRNCVCCLACWWREMHELEIILEYHRSSAAAQLEWDGILSVEIPHPNPALGIEVRACREVRNKVPASAAIARGTLLDEIVATASSETLRLPQFALLAIFRLRLQYEARLSKNQSSGNLEKRALPAVVASHNVRLRQRE